MLWFLLLIYAVCEFISPPNILRYNAGIERRWIETYQNKLSGMWYIFADKIFIAFADIYFQDNQEQQYETPSFYMHTLCAIITVSKLVIYGRRYATWAAGHLLSQLLAQVP